ncbi:MAG TPA: hypothetical protein VN578_02540 [Candidatus Binatia bacterium]|jgi:hypothetical protein|nr:hypothetical protein [Candidatus Binatia bacterium]
MAIPIKALVDRGLSLRKAIKRLTKALDSIETQLTSAALWRDQVELKDPDREGRRYLAQGSAQRVPVIFTADKLVASFQADSAVHVRIISASDGRIREFYDLARIYQTRFDDGKKFRAAAEEILGSANAPRFITACLARDKHGIPKSDTKVAWDDAEPI